MSTVKDTLDKDKSLHLDVSDIVKQMKSYESYEDGREERRPYSEKGENRNSTALLKININRFEPGGRNEFPPLWINPNNIDVNARYKGVAPMYVIDGEQFSSPQVVPNRIKETLRVMDEYVDIHNNSTIQPPDFIELMKLVEINPYESDGLPSDNLNVLAKEIQQTFHDFILTGSNDISTLGTTLQWITSNLTNPELVKGRFELGNKKTGKRLVIAQQLLGDKIAKKLLEEAGLDDVNKLIEIIGKGTIPDHSFQLMQNYAVTEREQQYDLLRQAVDRFREYNPVDELIDKGNVDDKEPGVQGNSDDPTSRISILDIADISKLKPLLEAYKPISEQYGNTIIFDSDGFLLRMLENRFGITLGTDGFIKADSIGKKDDIPIEVGENLLKSLNDLHEIVLRGKRGEKVGEKLSELRERKVEELGQNQQQIQDRISKMFPNEVVRRMRGTP